MESCLSKIAGLVIVNVGLLNYESIKENLTHVAKTSVEQDYLLFYMTSYIDSRIEILHVVS